MLHDQRLFENDRFFRIQAARHKIGHQAETMVLQLIGFGVTGGQSMPIGDEKITIIPVLQLNPVFQSAEVIAQVYIPGRTRAAENDLFSHKNPPCQSYLLTTSLNAERPPNSLKKHFQRIPDGHAERDTDRLNDVGKNAAAENDQQQKNQSDIPLITHQAVINPIRQKRSENLEPVQRRHRQQVEYRQNNIVKIHQIEKIGENPVDDISRWYLNQQGHRHGDEERKRRHHRQNNIETGPARLLMTIPFSLNAGHQSGRD